jgi:hypothetical protein
VRGSYGCRRFSAKNHIQHQQNDHDFEKKFPATKGRMLAPTPLSPIDSNGSVLDDAKFILDLIAEHDLVLSTGHLHITEIWPLLSEASARGVKRVLVNHPTYVVDATVGDIRELVRLGAYVGHSICMFVEGSSFKFYEPETLRELIKAGTVDRTILGSDLGQVNNPSPVGGLSSRDQNVSGNRLFSGRCG